FFSELTTLISSRLSGAMYASVPSSLSSSDSHVAIPPFSVFEKDSALPS
ncbi:MAG: hypothetical protein ACI9JZ_003077, partial [Lentimonas sp.]